MTKKSARILLALTSIFLTSGVVAATLIYLHNRKPPRDFLKDEANYYVADPIAGHLHRPGVTLEITWKEHPRGMVVLRTNNLGFREDSDTKPMKATGRLRILVTGDSHTDGVVNNTEAFPMYWKKN